MLWGARISLARLRPIGLGTLIKLTSVSAIFAVFLWGDYAVFQRLFRAVANIEALSPFFALGLLENFLGMVFLVGFFVLFFSSLTSAIGAFFTDLDLELHHAAPRSVTSIALRRGLKAFLQSSYLVVAFLLPMFAAFGDQFGNRWRVLIIGMFNLILLLSSAALISAAMIIALVRFFPVRRVHQVSASLAILATTMVVVGIRMARPERLFTSIDTDDLSRVLQAISLPSPELYPSAWLARIVVNLSQGDPIGLEQWKMAGLAAGAFVLFVAVSKTIYFTAFVRAKESSSPSAIGAGVLTPLLDWLTRGFEPQARAIFGKEVRTVLRDAAQWSQLFMLLALLFLYLYNIQMMPLEGDFRSALLAYLNLAMSGFVTAAICLRFAYPAVSSEGKQFWLLASAPISFRRFLWMKALVYLLPLLFLTAFLTALANWILDADPVIWAVTLPTSIVITSTLVFLGVGLGAMFPDMKTENPLQVATSIGGFAYMAISMIYAGGMLLLVARPLQRFVARVIFGFSDADSFLVRALPLAAAAAASLILTIVPMELGRYRLGRMLRE